ncbi:MAG: response regulator [Betaproteobacteria bacterium]|nr:response regulator [Betaproteobacteria bacterium]
MINRSRVAVVDDDPFVLRGVQRLLSSAGFTVETYGTGAEFMDAVRPAEPDCIVLDLHMPGTSGFDVQARLAQRGCTIPVIVITGDDTPEARSRALRLGAAAYLSKPVDAATLLAAIARVLAPASTDTHPGKPV